MFGILTLFYMGGSSLPGAQSEVRCACVCAIARVHVRARACQACSELTTHMTQGGSGLPANCKLIESGGGFDDHVECSKRTATSRLLGSMFSVRFAWLDCLDHINLSVHGAYARVLCPQCQHLTTFCLSVCLLLCNGNIDWNVRDLSTSLL